MIAGSNYKIWSGNLYSHLEHRVHEHTLDLDWDPMRRAFVL